MNSVRENILEYIMLQLALTPGLTVYRSRLSPVARNEGPVEVLVTDEDITRHIANQFVIREFLLKITVYARGDVPDQVADPYVGAIHAAIMNDRTLGGYASLTIDESTKWDFELADQDAVAIEMVYRVMYSTQMNSLGTMFS